MPDRQGTHTPCREWRTSLIASATPHSSLLSTSRRGTGKFRTQRRINPRQRSQHHTAYINLPFGLQGAPATFQRMMDKPLEGLEQFASAYMDDIIIFSTEWNAHLHQLSSVLDRIQKAGQLAMVECGYLGYRVGSGKVKPQDLKVEAIQQMLTPITKTQVRSLLGMAGYILPQIYTPVRFNYSSTY